MVARRDTKTGHEVIGNCADGSLELKRCPDGLNAAVQRHTDDEGDIEPIDVFVPI